LRTGGFRENAVSVFENKDLVAVCILGYFLLFLICIEFVCLSVFSCTALFVSISQVIGCEDRLRNDLDCVEWGVKLYSNLPTTFCGLS